MVREILVDWTTVNGGGKTSVMYFLDGTTVADQRAALGTWLASLEGGLHNTTSYFVRQEGRQLNTSTGALEGAWTETTDYSGTGTLTSGQPVPDATQILIRWSTDHVVNGRFLRGRTYIPGTTTTNVAGGNLAATIVSSYTTDSNTFVNAGVQLAIWHRPINGVGGVAWAVDSAQCWSEFAVQRRRRG